MTNTAAFNVLHLTVVDVLYFDLCSVLNFAQKLKYFYIIPLPDSSNVVIKDTRVRVIFNMSSCLFTTDWNVTYCI